MKHKTIKEHLEHNLPTDIYNMAIKCFENAVRPFERCEEQKALSRAFNWKDTKQGDDYWNAVNDKYFLMKDDTIIPEPKKVQTTTSKTMSHERKKELMLKLLEIKKEFIHADENFLYSLIQNDGKQFISFHADENFTNFLATELLNK